jgi:histidinol dehydrogenase
MKTYVLTELSKDELRRLCRRNPIYDREMLATCQEIFDRVADDGDAAIREFTHRFDGVDIRDCRVTPDELQEARNEVPADVVDAYKIAIHNIRMFHGAQRLSESPLEVQQGVTCWRAARPINSVGLYVPGGTAVLPSTVLMLGVPAKLAGCSRIVLCVPPSADGSANPEVLLAAQLSGVRQVFKVGGAQAVAAMALGTETVPKVEKILGPGNRFVQTAKLLATFYGVSIDMVAGPSEVLVIADETASPRIVASDLISQAEHGPDSQVVLVATSQELVEKVSGEVQHQLEGLPRRELAEKSIALSYAVLAPSLEEALDFSNLYAPEHLILSVKKARDWVGRVENAGSVFVGAWSPEVAGDYASGTNHTLPTSGMARSVSGVSLDSFIKKITFQELTREGLSDLAATLETLAELESLEGHARAVRYRMDERGDLEK